MHYRWIGMASGVVLALVLAGAFIGGWGNSPTGESPDATRETSTSNFDEEARREQLRSLGYINP